MTAVNDLDYLTRAFDELPVDLQEALKKYRSSGEWSGGPSFAYDLNLLLRNGTSLSSEARTLVNDLDPAIAAAKLAGPLTVYRGVGDLSHISNLTPGAIWQSPSYLSTSLQKDNLSTHIVPEFDGRVCGVLTIDLPADTPVAFLGGSAHSAQEAEMLLGRDHRFEIVSVADGKMNGFVRPNLHHKFKGLKEVHLKLIP